jgi:hypothetical protein
MASPRSGGSVSPCSRRTTRPPVRDGPTDQGDIADCIRPRRAWRDRPPAPTTARRCSGLPRPWALVPVSLRAGVVAELLDRDGEHFVLVSRISGVAGDTDCLPVAIESLHRCGERFGLAAGDDDLDTVGGDTLDNVEAESTGSGGARHPAQTNPVTAALGCIDGKGRGDACLAPRPRPRPPTSCRVVTQEACPSRVGRFSVG